MSTNSSIHQAMVLAAGLGTRMRPITDKLPKPLVKVAGRTMLDFGLDKLAAAGVVRAVVNVHHFADKVEAHLAHRKHPAITISDERGELLETGGGIKKALALLEDAPFFVYNSDSMWIEGTRPNFARLAEAWDSERMDILLMLSPTVDAVGYHGSGDFTMEASGRLTRRLEKRIAPFVYAGVAITHPSVFEGAPEGPFSFNLLFDRAIAEGRLYGMRMEGQWLHVGTPEAIDQAEEAIALSAE